MSEFKKNDAGKPQFDLLPLGLFSGVNDVLKHGAKKYGVGNWKKEDFLMSRAYNALLRHLIAFWGGEDTDKETGLSHLDHAMCNLIFLKYHHQNTPAADDRPVTKDPVDLEKLHIFGE